MLAGELLVRSAWDAVDLEETAEGDGPDDDNFEAESICVKRLDVGSSWKGVNRGLRGGRRSGAAEGGINSVHDSTLC